MEVCHFYNTVKWFVSRNPACGEFRFNELLLTSLEIERPWMNMIRFRKKRKLIFTKKTRLCTTMRDSENILEQSSFQKYTTCWVFVVLCHVLHLCICVFVYETLGNISFDILRVNISKPTVEKNETNVTNALLNSFRQAI